MIVFENAIIIASINENFIAVNLHSVESTAIRNDFLEVHSLKFVVYAKQGVVEFVT